MAPRPKPLEDRVLGGFVRCAPNECWPWCGRLRAGGYGVVKVGGHPGREVQAHRFMLERHLGRSLLPGMCALHKCDNRACCNPAHLFEGTKGDNNRDRHAKKRDALGDRNGSRTRPDRLRRGEQHPNARMTVALVQELRATYAEGSTSQAELGAKYGLDQTTVSDIVRRRRWAGVA